MAPKHKRKSNGVELKWKPMAIECAEGLNNEDFEGLVAIEELDQYGIVRDNGQVITSGELKNTKRKKKKKKQSKVKSKKTKTQSGFTVETIESETDEEDDRVVELSTSHQEMDMSKWVNLSVPDHIVQCLRELEMNEPTEIQRRTIEEAIVHHRDVFGAAPTGSGKTLAFAIPMVTNIVASDSQDECLKAIVLTPTRELAVQIKRHIENICKHNGVKVALVVGGLAIQKQERILQRIKPDIVVATPGRLWEMVSGGSVTHLNRDALATIRYLVIDEADRMVEKSHFEELRFIVNFLNESHTKRQVFIFSATLTMVKGKKSKLQKKSEGDAMSEQNLIKLLNLEQDSLLMCDLTEGGTKSKPGSEQLQESIIHCMKDEKDLYLYYFITSNRGRTLVFCNSIDCIRRLLNIFRFLQLSPLAVHSSMPQKRRLTSIEKFTKEENCILLATDVAARGLDIASVDHVVHYQVPRNAETYVHRSGRTARATNKGLSLILCDPQEEAFFLKEYSKIINRNSLQDHPVNMSILKRLKERIKLAQACDTLEHQLRKERSNENWFKESAKACEIYDSDLDSDKSDDDESNVQSAKAKDRRRLKAYRQQLTALLRQKIVIPRSIH